MTSASSLHWSRSRALRRAQSDADPSVLRRICGLRRRRPQEREGRPRGETRW